MPNKKPAKAIHKLEPQDVEIDIDYYKRAIEAEKAMYARVQQQIDEYSQSEQVYYQYYTNLLKDEAETRLKTIELYQSTLATLNTVE